MTQFNDGDKVIVFNNDDNEFFFETYKHADECEQDGCFTRGVFYLDNDWNPVGLCFEHLLKQYGFVQIIKAAGVNNG